MVAVRLGAQAAVAVLQLTIGASATKPEEATPRVDADDDEGSDFKDDQEEHDPRAWEDPREIDKALRRVRASSRPNAGKV